MQLHVSSLFWEWCWDKEMCKLCVQNWGKEYVPYNYKFIGSDTTIINWTADDAQYTFWSNFSTSTYLTSHEKAYLGVDTLSDSNS